MIGKMRWLLLCVGILTSVSMRGGDQYQVDDTLYLWCKRGFKLRERPAMDAKVISILSSAAQVTVVYKTDTPIHIRGFWKPSWAKAPLPGRHHKILYGSWVCVRTKAGDVGFVLDQYLLKLRPAREHDSEYLSLKIPIEHRDTIRFVRDEANGYTELLEIKTRYLGGIVVHNFGNSKGSEAEYVFPNLTIEEVVVILRYSTDGFEHCEVLRNWPNELWVQQGGCHYRMIRSEGIIKVSVGCYC